MAKVISDELKSSAGESSPVAFVATNAPSDLVCLYAIWLSGNVAVPVGKGHEFEDALRDAGCRLIIVTDSESASKAGYLRFYLCLCTTFHHIAVLSRLKRTRWPKS